MIGGAAFAAFQGMAKRHDTLGVIAKQNQLARDLVDAVRGSDIGRFAAAFDALDDHEDTFTRAMRDIAKLPRPSGEFQSLCVRLCARHADRLRDMTTGANMMAAGLRVLLPPYTGPALTIYRGDSWVNRSKRTYGPSWTTSIEGARTEALGIANNCVGGSVLLETMAPADAIVCALGLIDDRYAEQEIVVEPRRLMGKINVIERFAQASPDKLTARTFRYIGAAPTITNRVAGRGVKPR